MGIFIIEKTLCTTLHINGTYNTCLLAFEVGTNNAFKLFVCLLFSLLCATAYLYLSSTKK